MCGNFLTTNNLEKDSQRNVQSNELCFSKAIQFQHVLWFAFFKL